MGALIPFLHDEFARLCPPAWRARAEVSLLGRELNRLLGYGPRADLLLEREDETPRIWIEIEVSRADPVSNHAKFATAHLFAPQSPRDTFLAMVSPHVSRGRRNPAANTIALMRHIGMSAFQTVLFPRLHPDEVKRLNHLGAELGRTGLPVTEEVKRVLSVTEPVAAAGPTVLLPPSRFCESKRDERMRGERCFIVDKLGPKGNRALMPSVPCTISSSEESKEEGFSRMARTGRISLNGCPVCFRSRLRPAKIPTPLRS